MPVGPTQHSMSLEHTRVYKSVDGLYNDLEKQDILYTGMPWSGRIGKVAHEKMSLNRVVSQSCACTRDSVGTVQLQLDIHPVFSLAMICAVATRLSSMSQENHLLLPIAPAMEHALSQTLQTIDHP